MLGGMHDLLPPGRRPRHGRRAALLAVAVLLTVLGVVPSPPAAAQDPAAAEPVPQVWDPRPAPGSVVDGTTVVLAARVTDRGDQPVTFLVDGQRMRGPRVDPDGELSDLTGIEVTLAPGPHEVTVAVGTHGVLRRWPVTVAGMAVQPATEDAVRLLRRLSPAADGSPSAPLTSDRTSRARSGPDQPAVAAPVVLLDLDRPDLALPVPALARALGATVLPLRPAQLTPGVLRTLEGTTGEVVALGEASVDPELVTTLTATGRDVTVLPGTTTATVSAQALQLARSRAPDGDGPRTLVVAPTVPFDAALAGAAAATRLGADLLLVDLPLQDRPAAPPSTPVDDDTPGSATLLDVDTRAAVAQATTVLLSADLGPGARDAVIDAMGPEAVASDDALAPLGATEAVVLPDGLDRGRAVVAAVADTPDRPVLVGARRALDWTAANRPDRVTVVRHERAPGPWPVDPTLPALALVVALDAQAPAIAPPVPLVSADGGPPHAVVPDGELADQLRRAWVDGPGHGPGRVVLQDGPTATLGMVADGPVQDADVHVTVLGYEWPGTVTTDGPAVTWRAQPRPPLPLPLEPATDDTPLPVEVMASLTTPAGTVHRRGIVTLPVDPVDTVSPEGWLVAGGSDPPVGSGRLYTYSVEVEPQTGLDLRAVEAEVTRILTDPRSWTADGSVTFQRVGRPQAARLRVVVARPATVDAMCGAVGLRTGGRVSCWDGYRAMLNLDRWATGVVPFHADLTVYRQYLVNHEVGHGLGHGHEFCPRPGAIAPVMMQQTGGLGSCRANGWPFP